MKKKAPNPGVIVETLSSQKPQDDEMPDDSGVEACAEALIRGVHSGDVKAVAQAMRDAFEIMELQPHDEQSPEPHSYEAQNMNAGEQE